MSDLATLDRVLQTADADLTTEAAPLFCGSSYYCAAVENIGSMMGNGNGGCCDNILPLLLILCCCGGNGGNGCGCF